MDYSCLLIRINETINEKFVCMSAKLTTKNVWYIILPLESYHILSSISDDNMYHIIIISYHNHFITQS